VAALVCSLRELILSRYSINMGDKSELGRAVFISVILLKKVKVRASFLFKFCWFFVTVPLPVKLGKFASVDASFEDEDAKDIVEKGLGLAAFGAPVGAAIGVVVAGVGLGEAKFPILANALPLRLVAPVCGWVVASKPLFVFDFHFPETLTIRLFRNVSLDAFSMPLPGSGAS